MGVCDIHLPVAGEVNFDHLLKSVSAEFFYQKVTIFPFVIDKYFPEIDSSISTIFYSLNITHPVLASLTTPA